MVLQARSNEPAKRTNENQQNVTRPNPESGELTCLYHPRKDRWEDHFRRVGAFILGHTAVGRTTASLLRSNDADNLSQRLLVLVLGELD
jgi:hypothetical protein